MRAPDPSVKGLLDAVASPVRPPKPTKLPSGMTRTEFLRQQARERTVAMFDAAFERQRSMTKFDNATLDELLPARAFVAWRIGRELAIVSNGIGRQDPLIDAPEELWRVVQPPDTVFGSELNTVGRSRLADAYNELVRRQDGFRIGPPDDPDLHELWCSVVDGAAEALGVGDRGDMKAMKIQNQGLAMLAHAPVAAEAWPSRDQILTIEEMMIEETLKSVIEQSQNAARKRLMSSYGLSDPEASMLLMHARRRAQTSVLSGDIEDHRALTVLRMEDIAERAREGLDLRAELAAYKEISHILGLRASETSDTMEEITDTLVRIANERKSVRNEALPKGANE